MLKITKSKCAVNRLDLIEYFPWPGFPCGSDSKESACNVGNPWSLDREGPLEKEMATHSSILTWEIPWEKEPGRLQSIGQSQIGLSN